MALVAPWIVPESTSIVVVPLPTVVVEMPLPKPVVTSAATVTAMLPRSALKASIPSLRSGAGYSDRCRRRHRHIAVSEVEGVNAVAAGRVDDCVVENVDSTIHLRIWCQRRASE